MRDHDYYVYFMTNKRNTVLYVGVTNDLERRISEHKSKSNPDCFTAKYNLDKLVYFEEFGDIDEAIEREKQIKSGSRARKDALVNSVNPNWQELALSWE